MPNSDELKGTQFAREYTEMFSYISRYVAFRVPHKDSAEDIVSEVFVYGYAHLGTFDSTRGNMRQWLTGIAKHKIADHWRNLRPTEEMHDAMQLCSTADNLALDDALDATRQWEEIITQLTPEARALLTLRYIDGMTHEEIALLVEKKPSTIRTFFSRVRATIRQTHSL